MASLLCGALYAQDERVVERLYIATDKQSYIAGDRIWCSLYCFEAEQKMDLSQFSSTAYLELLLSLVRREISLRRICLLLSVGYIHSFEYYRSDNLRQPFLE